MQKVIGSSLVLVALLSLTNARGLTESMAKRYNLGQKVVKNNPSSSKASSMAEGPLGGFDCSTPGEYDFGKVEEVMGMGDYNHRYLITLYGITGEEASICTHMAHYNYIFSIEKPDLSAYLIAK